MKLRKCKPIDELKFYMWIKDKLKEQEEKTIKLKWQEKFNI